MYLLKRRRGWNQIVILLNDNSLSRDLVLNVVDFLDPINCAGGGGGRLINDQIRRFSMDICLGCLGIFGRHSLAY